MTKTALLQLHLQASPDLMYCLANSNGNTLSIPDLHLMVVVDEQDTAHTVPQGWTLYRCSPDMVKTGKAIETIEILARLKQQG
jgi:hypothetical protein